MPALVPVPWQPHLFVAPSYLARLQRASDLAGHKIALNSIKSPTGRYLAAWRALEEAIYLYDLYKHHGGAVASNPYTGKRYHLRGAGGDIRDRADRKAMLDAGFLPDPDEWWHFSDPNWAVMPIIAINTTTAGHGTTTISPKEEEDDDMYIISDGQAKYLVGGTNIVHMSGPEDAVFTRLLVKKDGAFALPEVQMVESVLQRLQSPLAASSQQVTTSFRQVTDGLDSMVNRDQHSLKVIHESVSAVKPSTGGGVAIDYDILASKVADKLAARLVS
jgi:hypothetical protein